MARSLGLQAYRAFSRRGDASNAPPEIARPDGELVWLHSGETGNMLAVQDLAYRLVAARNGLSVLITYGEGETPPPLPDRPNSGVIQTQVPGEHPQSVKQHLGHWQPDACIWTWGDLRPNLITQTAETGCPMFFIDADIRGFDAGRNRWLPDLTRLVLSQFNIILARSEAGRKRLQSLNKALGEVEITSPLLAGGQPLPCADSDLSDLSAAIGGRPVWFATGVLPKEVPIVLSAHAKALRLSHRMLLVLQPASPNQTTDIIETAQHRNMNTINWGQGHYPDDITQVMVADDPADTGLFLRIAPVSFLGSSLIASDGGCDPLDAASLGSAVLYGPKVRHFLPSYSRLAAAGAARIVNDADALGNAVSRLIAPDQAATMAHAGWDVISEGAALTDRVIDMIQDALDDRMITK
jgi:3-deoxy-D-manno-octulosonic-acid transferase